MSSEPQALEPERRPVGQGLISGTAWTALHVILSVPVAFLVNIVVARSLGVASYGHLAVLTMAITLATSAASLGVGAALMQFVTKAAEAGQRSEVSKLVAGAQGYNVLIAAPLVAVVVSCVVDVPVPFLVLAITFGVFAPAALQVGPILLAAQHRSDRAAQLAIVSNLVVQVAVVLTVLVQPSPEAVWVARVVAVGSMMILPFLAMPPWLRRVASRPRAPWRLPSAFWAFAVPTGLATLISKLVTDRVQIFFLQWLADPVAVGLFSLAFGLALQVLTPVQSAVGPLLPAFAALAGRGHATAREGLLRVTRVSALATGGVLALGVPVLAGLIPFLYGSAYAAASDYFVVMACSAGVVVTGSVAYASLMARLRGRSYLYINLVSLAVTVGLAMVVIPGWGSWGAVTSMVGGGLTRALLMVVLEVRHYRISRQGLMVAFAPAVLAILAVLLVWFGLIKWADWGYWSSAVFGGTLATGLFLLAVRATRSGLLPQDRQSLLSALPSRARGAAGALLRVVSSPNDS